MIRKKESRDLDKIIEVVKHKYMNCNDREIKKFIGSKMSGDIK